MRPHGLTIGDSWFYEKFDFRDSEGVETNGDILNSNLRNSETWRKNWQVIKKKAYSSNRQIIDEFCEIRIYLEQ